LGNSAVFLLAEKMGAASEQKTQKTMEIFLFNLLFIFFSMPKINLIWQGQEKIIVAAGITCLLTKKRG
jgi:hypothetical protein